MKTGLREEFRPCYSYPPTSFNYNRLLFYHDAFVDKVIGNNSNNGIKAKLKRVGVVAEINTQSLGQEGNPQNKEEKMGGIKDNYISFYIWT